MPEPSEEQAARYTLAVIAKATRLLLLAESPFGTFGEVTEFGSARILPDYTIQEMLYGLSYQDIDFTAIEIDAEDVIRGGFNTTVEDFNAERIPDIELAIDAARGWVDEYLQGLGIA